LFVFYDDYFSTFLRFIRWQGSGRMQL